MAVVLRDAADAEGLYLGGWPEGVPDYGYTQYRMIGVHTLCGGLAGIPLRVVLERTGAVVAVALLPAADRRDKVPGSFLIKG